jgi:ADP-heptose:LPS heptosyltransferase
VIKRSAARIEYLICSHVLEKENKVNVVIGCKKPIRSLLFVRTDSIGDSVLSASMLPHIRRKYRDAAITVVCQEHIAELYEACPYIDDVVVFNRQRALHDDRYREEIVMQLRALKPDVSLNSVYSRGGLTDWFALKCGAAQRIAFDGDSCNIPTEFREMHSRFYTDILPSPGVYKLELERSKDFLRGLDIEPPDLQPMIWMRPEDEAFARRLFEDSGLDPAATIAMFAGAQHDCRIYESYGAAISEFCKANRMQIIALGAEQDRDINQRNLDAAGVKGVNLSGRTSILRSAAVLKRCRIAVGAETGLAHICCAVGTPNVILLGGGHFGRFMPYSSLTSVVCLPLDCYGCNWGCRYEKIRCVKDVAPAVIAEALRRSCAESSHKIRVFAQSNSLWQAQNGRPAWKPVENFLPTDKIEVLPIEAGSNPAIVGGRIESLRIPSPAKLPTTQPQGDTVEHQAPGASPQGVPGRTCGDDRITIATSISPKEIETQARAIESWMKLGFRVVSINCSEEIGTLHQSFPEVEFVHAKRDARALFGRPLVYFDEFLDYFRTSGSNICGIVNSDIRLRADRDIIPFIEGQAAGGLLYGPRTEIDSPDAIDGEICPTGFDFFFFDRSIIPCFEPSEFCIRMPWWDYWMPLMPILKGFPVKRLASPLAYHLKHPGRWKEDKWLFLAKKLFNHLRERMDREFPNPKSLWAELGRIFSAHHRRYLIEKGLSDASQMSVSIIYPSVLEFLNKHSQEVSAARAEPAAREYLCSVATDGEDIPAYRPRRTIGGLDDSEPQCDVSIVICTKDRAELLDQMLNSLEEAASGIVYELIVVEGGSLPRQRPGGTVGGPLGPGDSSDNTLEVLRAHNVWNVYNESKHLGLGRHSWPELYNFAFSRATGKWAMYASDDIVFGPNAVSRAVKLLERQKEAVAGGIFFYRNAYPTREEWAEYGIDFTHGNKLLMNYGLIRLKSFREVGGFDEAYNFYCADTDLCYKLYERGRELVPMSGCFVRHENLLDVRKLVNSDASGRDIELCQQRWSHFVPTENPMPARLLWRDDLARAFDVAGELENIDSGIESFWHGLAFFEQSMFAEAEREFIKAVQLKCDHRQVLWYLAMAADKCRDNAIAAKAAAGVVRLAPGFEPAMEILLRATGAKQYSIR